MVSCAWEIAKLQRRISSHVETRSKHRYLRKKTNATVNKRISVDEIYARTRTLCNRFVTGGSPHTAGRVCHHGSYEVAIP